MICSGFSPKVVKVNLLLLCQDGLKVKRFIQQELRLYNFSYVAGVSNSVSIPKVKKAKLYFSRNRIKHKKNHPASKDNYSGLARDPIKYLASIL